MFGKTKIKIVFTVVFSLLALMIVTLTTIYLSNRIAIRNQNNEMLGMYLELYGTEDRRGGFEPDEMPEINGENQPTAPPDMSHNREPVKNEPRFRLSTFYSVVFTQSGEVAQINNGNSSVQSEDALIEIASAAVKSGKESGSSGNIYYRVASRGDKTVVAMIDGTIDDGNLRLLFRQMLIIGSVAVAVLLVISVIIARRIVRPLEENDKKQKRFVSDAGHELKTPVAVISANSELLKRQIGDNEWLSNIDYENERMSELIKQLLALSKAENGEIPKETLDFSKLVNGEVLPFESLAFEKGKRIISETEEGIYTEGNGAQLKQLVSILLDNAVSHGTDDEISLSLKSERHFAVLEVANKAKVLDEEQLKHLFDRFYRTDGAREDSGAHYGLGLSIAQAVTEAHKGQISADYKNGKAVFTVKIPIKKHEN